MKVIMAPAKINIILRVLGSLPNGYHDLLMLNEKLDLADEINIEARSMKQETGEKIVITCDDPAVPCDETNLCYKAAKLVYNEIRSRKACFARACSASLAKQALQLHIHIKKRIPVAAGLGGGSSDAAAVLKGLNELFSLKLSGDELAEIGVSLGADVPFFLYDGPAVCEGIGDKITTLNLLPNMWILLVNPGFPVSTKWVYDEFDRRARIFRQRRIRLRRRLKQSEREGYGGKERGSTSESFPPLLLTEKRHDVSSLRRGFRGLPEVARVVHNDLEMVTAGRYPEIEQIKKLLLDCGAVCSWMSGSGPTVVGMFEMEKGFIEAADVVRKRSACWRVIETRNF